MSEVCFLIHRDVGGREREWAKGVGRGSNAAIDSPTAQSLEATSHGLKDSHKQMYSYALELILNWVHLSTCSCDAPQRCRRGCFPDTSGWRMQVFTAKIRTPD